MTGQSYSHKLTLTLSKCGNDKAFMHGWMIISDICAGHLFKLKRLRQALPQKARKDSILGLKWYLGSESSKARFKLQHAVHTDT